MRSSPAKGWAAARPVVAAAREGRSQAREEIRRRETEERGGEEPEALSG